VKGEHEVREEGMLGWRWGDGEGGGGRGRHAGVTVREGALLE
jgi:hypothetical protein